ncbi:hypothetical protein JK358_04220 [Nocardia sp. 2]|uniref:DUF8017 domain-containing protein n=1 Tax=Nocardia acididurans TaxID=2802282 RepID=A0ABS1M0L0_9NOCA|nr:hypothetical protein [Nocardia acididurans]MBL1073590.1 hypothetical protein [Nocardia acididurans]
MTGGTDDPERGGANPDWWQGTPPPGSPWESHPHHPVQPGAGQSDPTTQQAFQPPGPNPYQSGGNPQQGPNPYQSGPNPQQGANPYQSGPSPQQGATPYQSGSMPQPGYPGGQQPQAAQGPFQTGPNASQSGRPPYGGTSPYGGYGPPPSDGRGRVWLYSGIGALVVAIVAVIATVVVINDDSGGGGGPTTTSAIASTTTRTTTSRTTTSPRTTTRASTPASVIPGYQVVAPSDVDAAWDVPADWTLNTSITSFGTGSDELPVSGLAQEGIDYCPDYVRTNMFLTVSSQADAAAAAADIGARMANLGWPNPTVNATSPEPFANTDKSLNGVYVETSGSFTPPASSCASTYTVYTFAVSGGSSGSLVLTLAADTGIDRAVARDLARRILATFRFI